MNDDIWVLGATGRPGRGIAQRLHGTGHSIVLAGRDAARLAPIAAGFGVCEGRPAPARVRVDAIPSLATEKGIIGSALAGSMLDGAPDGGRRVERGRLVRFAVAGARQQLTTPAGDTVTTAALPTGDLLAAWRASRAEEVISASSMIPSGPAVRAAFPALSVLMRWPALRRFAIGRVARLPVPERARPRTFSWGHQRKRTFVK